MVKPDIESLESAPTSIENLDSQEGPRMWTSMSPWQITQLGRLAKFDPERAETILNTLWAMYPTLRTELAIGAVEQGELDVQEASKLLGLATDDIECLVDQFRRAHAALGDSNVTASDRGAKVTDSQMFVWEIVREYRKLGSVELLTEAFPSLTRAQLGAALSYAREHPEEIEQAISAYEEVQRKKRAEYPFAVFDS